MKSLPVDQRRIGKYFQGSLPKRSRETDTVRLCWHLLQIHCHFSATHLNNVSSQIYIGRLFRRDPAKHIPPIGEISAERLTIFAPRFRRKKERQLSLALLRSLWLMLEKLF